MINIEKAPEPKSIVLGPKQAAQYLKLNTNNRPLSKSRVSSIANDIKEDRWDYNGNTIVISDDGILLDGQHRLQAIIQADKEVPIILLDGIKAEAFKTIDTGKRRTNGDALGMIGFVNVTTLAGVAKLYKSYTRMGQKFGRFIEYRYTNAEVVDIVREFPDIEDSVSATLSFSYSQRRHLKPMYTALCYHITKQIDAHAADAFLASIVYGDNLRKRDPRLRLRQKLIDKTFLRVKIPSRIFMEMYFRAWNAWCAGDDNALLRETGQLPELLTGVPTLEELAEEQHKGYVTEQDLAAAEVS